MIDAAQAATPPGLQVELGGQAIEQAQQQRVRHRDRRSACSRRSSCCCITFGSFVAMGLPIITALLGLGTGLGLIGLARSVARLPDFATELAAMIGLGVGIDYALFIVTRYRENYRARRRRRGRGREAMDTAGRAVLFAGATVIIALLGMFLLGVNFLYGLAIAAVARRADDDARAR